MIEVILPSGSEINALMITGWLISPLIGEVTMITGGCLSVMANLQFHMMDYLNSHKLILIEIPLLCSNQPSLKIVEHYCLHPLAE
jgi:hypothetical protein